MAELTVTRTENEMGAWAVTVTDGQKTEEDDGTLALGHPAMSYAESTVVERYLRSFFDETEDEESDA